MQRRRLRRALACLAAVLIIAGPVSAQDFTGSEEEERTLQCPKSGQSVPENQEKPGAGECQGTDTTYRGKVWTNDVTCASGGTDVGGAATLYTTGGGTSGGVGICNDGGAVPVQGRVVAQGSPDGGSVYADGDKDNANEQAQGFARLDVDGAGPKVRCGDTGGRKDASAPTGVDGQDDCG
jgi:hypothetical protein